MSSPNILFQLIAKSFLPFLYALLHTLGTILLIVAVVIVILLLVDDIVQRRKLKSGQQIIVPPPVIKEIEVKEVAKKTAEPVVVPAPEKPVAEIPPIAPAPVMPVEEPIITEEPVTRFSLQDDANALATTFKKRCEEKNLSFSIELDDRMPAQISGQKQWLNNLLEQLFDIALHQTTEGAISLKIKMVKANDNAATMQFLFTDTGAGLPVNIIRAVQEKDFQYQADEPLQQSVLIQLHEIKKTVEGHSGRLTLASRAGAGTTAGILIEFGL